jgi:hypothetical protein
MTTLPTEENFYHIKKILQFIISSLKKFKAYDCYVKEAENYSTSEYYIDITPNCGGNVKRIIMVNSCAMFGMSGSQLILVKYMSIYLKLL